MTTDDYDRVAQGVYNALELMSDVSAASLGQHVHAGKPGAKVLQFTDEPAHIRFKRRYDGCRTDTHRRECIEDGFAEIKALRYSRHPAVDCQTLDGRLTVGRDQRPASVVAHAYGYSTRHVHRLRDEARRYDERNGRKTPGAPGHQEELAA